MRGIELNIRKKPIESVRIRTDRAQALKDKAFEISMKAKDLVSESELVNFLIDNELEKMDVTKEGKLFIRKD